MATHITTTPGVQGGAPCIEGTRTPVRTIVLLYYITYPQNIEQILRALPHLCREEIEDALAYYETNRAEVDADIERHRSAFETLQGGIAEGAPGG